MHFFQLHKVPKQAIYLIYGVQSQEAGGVVTE